MRAWSEIGCCWGGLASIYQHTVAVVVKGPTFDCRSGRARPDAVLHTHYGGGGDSLSENRYLARAETTIQIYFATLVNGIENPQSHDIM